MGKESCPGPTVLGQQQAASQATQAILTATQAVMVMDVRALSWPKTRLSAIFFFFQMKCSFPTLPINSFGAEIWGPRRYMEKRKEKSSQLHKAFPWKSPGSGVLRTCGCPPPTLWSSGFAG